MNTMILLDVMCTVEYPFEDELYAANWMDESTEKSVDDWMAIVNNPRVQVRDGCVIPRNQICCNHECYNPLVVLDLV